MALAIGPGACGAVDPYLYKADEFDRNSPTFNKQPADRDEATICYNGIVTSEAVVAEMAATGMRQVRQDGTSPRRGVRQMSTADAG